MVLAERRDRQLRVPRAAAVIRGRRAAGCAGAPKNSYREGWWSRLSDTTDNTSCAPCCCCVTCGCRSAGCAGAHTL